MKPLGKRNFAEAALAQGVSGLNIDGCRVEHVIVAGGSLAYNPQLRSRIAGGCGGNVIAHEEERRFVKPNNGGRFPANVVHDGSDEVTVYMPNNSDDSTARFFKECSWLDV